MCFIIRIITFDCSAATPSSESTNLAGLINLIFGILTTIHYFYPLPKTFDKLLKEMASNDQNNASNVTIETLMRVFNALQAKVMLSVELPHFKISLGQ